MFFFFFCFFSFSSAGVGNRGNLILLWLFSHQVVSESLRPHRLRHSGPPCPSQSWSLPKFMSIVWVMPSNHLILCRPLLLPSIPASASFPMSRLFTSGDQTIGASSVSVLLMSIQGWFLLGLTGLISLLSKGLSRVFQHHQWLGIDNSSELPNLESFCNRCLSFLFP